MNENYLLMLNSIPDWMLARLDRADALLKDRYSVELLINRQLTMTLASLEKDDDDDAHTPEAHKIQHHTCDRCDVLFGDMTKLWSVLACKKYSHVLGDTDLMLALTLCENCTKDIDASPIDVEP